MKKSKLMRKRIGAVITAAAVMVTAAPVAVFAAESIPAETEGEVSEEAVSEDGQQLLASFDFESVDGDVFDGGGAVARAMGNYELQDMNGSKVIYLDESADSYLNVTKADGSSLLTGLSSVTLSFDAKTDKTGTGWYYYAAPDNRTQSSPEYYVGGFINNGKLKVERYLNGRTQALENISVGSDWAHIDVIYADDGTYVYVNDALVSSVSGGVSLTDILGSNSILQIGKANWGSGEYFKGWLDNYKIYAGIPEAYAEQLMEEKIAGIADMTISAEIQALPNYNGTVTWKSDSDRIVIGEDGRTASIIQPEVGEDAVQAQLTAVVQAYGLTREVTVNATIRAKIGEDDPYGYLMVHFVEDSAGYQEKIYLDISQGDNPEYWEPLNGRQPILASNLGKTGVRDPYLTYNPETETYYILGTDLRVFGGDNAGWGAWQKKYSTQMDIWESKDLISWSPIRQIDVTLRQDGTKEETLGMMWAPECTWVPDYYGDHGAFVVYWSSNVYSDSTQSQSLGSHIMYGVTTDFTQDTWEYGGKFLDGGDAGYIDTTIIQNEGITYHITKSYAEQIIMESTDAWDWWNLETTKWTRIQSRIGQSRFGSVEGPAVFKDHSTDNKWYLFVDDLPTPGYQPMVSTDLNAGWDYLDSEGYFLTSMTKHGGVISLTKKQYDAIRKADAVSVVKKDLGTKAVAVNASEKAVQEALPATAEVNTAYNYGVSELPVSWDVSTVDTTKTGEYSVTGTVQSIGANLNQWVGEGGSTAYDAPNRTLYSSTALTVTASVVVEDRPSPTPEPTVSPKPTNPPEQDIHKAHVGKTFIVDKLKYKVTKDDGKVQEVRVTSLQDKKLKKLVIPKTVTNPKWKETFKVTSVKAKAFRGTGITKVTIGANVTKIGPNAFLNCKKLKSAVIGKQVKSIGIRAFYGCEKLKKITVKSTVLAKVKKNAFKKISKKATITINKKAKKNAYKKLLKGTVAKGVKIK